MRRSAGAAAPDGINSADQEKPFPPGDRTLAVHPTAAEELVTMRTPAVVKKPVAVG